jgi:hypothetical protein
MSTEPALPLIEGPEDFAPAVCWAVQHAVADGSRVITAVDTEFGAHWPWDDTTLLATLVGWFKLPQRRLVLLAAHYDGVPRQHPRFTAWRRDWAHAIDSRVAPEEMAATLPTLLFDDRHTSVVRHDAISGRGRVSVTPRTRLHWAEPVDAVLQRSSAGFAVTTLGL